MVGLGPHLATERARLETPHLPVRAPGIYPDASRKARCWKPARRV